MPKPQTQPKIEIPSILQWILDKKIKTEKGDLLNWDDRPFLIDILSDWSPRIVIKKCAQVGGSVTFNLKVMYAVEVFRWNVIYTMPTDGDVADFVKTKTNEIIKANSHVPSFAGMSQDSIYLKEINGRFIHFKGTISKSAAISTTSDLNVHDEASRSDQKSMKTYESRYQDSLFQGNWKFSNPTTEKDALDEEWKKSDQKEWHVECEACGYVQTLTWPESINRDKGIYQCKQCSEEISDEARLFGKWLPTRLIPIGKPYISGYHMTQMMRVSKSAQSILEDADGDQEYFFNFVLGEPYNPGDLSVSRGTITDIWTPTDIKTGEWFLGVDVGNIKHYVLGSELGPVKIGRFNEWSELDTLMTLYKPSLVIDAMPDNTAARAFVNKYRNARMSFFQENKSDPKNIVWWGEGDKRGIVYSNRNRILDQMITDIAEAKFNIGVTPDPEFNRYLKHWETLRRTKVTDARGIESYEWDSTTGEDHYVFATLYWYLAVLARGAGVFISEDKAMQPKMLIGSDNVVGDLGEIMAANNGWGPVENDE